MIKTNLGYLCMHILFDVHEAKQEKYSSSHEF